MSSLIISDINAINETAKAFLEQIGDKTIFAFLGKMGAGKTTFIKAICEELEVQDVINSPTFSIVNEYFSQKRNDIIYHFDFYRINSIQEALNLGTEDYFDSGRLCFIEWPEKIEILLPEETVFVRIEELSNGTRKVEFRK